ncbi:MAG: hypothetical protein N0E54_02970 [Candidatus Thiodiazotropha taylori]|nr:hypothetical protein [Candidatus Thiodiazotropha endolucinida]MCW4227688.1 hypothetical protein [Candidatus Thiodiazotropha taylori]
MSTKALFYLHAFFALILNMVVLVCHSDEVDRANIQTTTVSDEFPEYLEWRTIFGFAPEPDLVLLDTDYIAKECSSLSNIAVKKTRSKESKKIALDLCEEVKIGRITEDQWLDGINSHTQTIYNTEYYCATCIQMYIRDRRPLPRGLGVYVLALVPATDWYEDEYIIEFRYLFARLGNAIGDARIAVWLGNPPDINKFELGFGAIDTERSKQYCNKLDLDYNNGPYILISKTYPDDLIKNSDYIIIKFNGIAKNRVGRVLNRLEQELRLNRVDEKRRVLLYEEVKQRLLSMYDEHNEAFKEIVVKWVGG